MSLKIAFLLCADKYLNSLYFLREIRSEQIKGAEF